MAVTRLTTNGLTGTKYDIASADNYYMEPIATQLFTSSGTTSVTFSNIPQGYKHLQVRFIARNNDTASAFSNDLSWRYNGDAGGSNYARHRLYGTGSATGASGVADVSYASSELGIIPNNSYTSGVFGAGIIDILDYANTNKFKTSRLLGGIEGNTNDTNSRLVLNSNLWRNTAGINQIEFFVGTGGIGFIQNSRISLYGIKG